MGYILLGELQVRGSIFHDLKNFHTRSWLTADQNGVQTVCLFVCLFCLFFEEGLWLRFVEILVKITELPKNAKQTKSARLGVHERLILVIYILHILGGRKACLFFLTNLLLFVSDKFKRYKTRKELFKISSIFQWQYFIIFN